MNPAKIVMRFLLKPLVSRVNRRDAIRRVRLDRSTWLVANMTEWPMFDSLPVVASRAKSRF